MAEHKRDAPLSFTGNVNIAVRIVQDKYPAAVLYEVEANAPGNTPTTDTRDVTVIRAVFGVDGSTVFISATEPWGTWAAPTVVSKPWGGDRVTPWPVDYDLVPAYATLRAARYTQPFTGVTLRWPLSFDAPEEPSYYFGFEDGSTVRVGVDTHVVEPVTV